MNFLRSERWSATLLLIAAFAVLGAVACSAPRPEATRSLPRLPAVPPNQLRSLADFAVVMDRRDRSRALFLEASKVLLHPRCATDQCRHAPALLQGQARPADGEKLSRRDFGAQPRQRGRERLPVVFGQHETRERFRQQQPG